MAGVALWSLAWALIAIDARATYGARVSADEPQYLTTALSLGTDFDLDISDELSERSFVPYHEIDLNPQTRPLNEAGQRLSPHDPLLPLLLAAPMRAGGWVAAKATLALFAALTAAAALWLAVRRFGVGLGIAAGVVAAFFATPPLVAYGSQVYPEMPAALCVTLGLAAVCGPLGRGARAAAAVTVVALPWLSVKYVPLAAVIALAVVVRMWPHRRRALLAEMVVYAIAGAVYLWLASGDLRRVDRVLRPATISSAANSAWSAAGPTTWAAPGGWWACWWTASSASRHGCPRTWSCPVRWRCWHARGRRGGG